MKLRKLGRIPSTGLETHGTGNDVEGRNRYTGRGHERSVRSGRSGRDERQYRELRCTFDDQQKRTERVIRSGVQTHGLSTSRLQPIYLPTLPLNRPYQPS